MANMAENGQNGLKWLDNAGNGWKCMEQLEMAGNGNKWLWNGWK